jgi:hypothetical protein
MAYRTTSKDLDRVQEMLNSNVKHLGIEFMWNSRNGYHALDYRMENEGGGHGIDTFRTGLSMGQVCELMNAMNWIAQLAKEKGKERARFFLEYLGA